MDPKLLIQLRDLLNSRFNEGELRTLCFDLVVDYDGLPGASKADKARELVAHCQRRNRLDELVHTVKQRRPDIDWDVWPDLEPSDKPYHNLPQPDYGLFVGRDEELNQVHRLLSPKSRHFLVTIAGIGGIGKSTLALEVAHRYLRDYDRLPEQERFEAVIWTSAKSSVLTADGITSRRQITRNLSDVYATISTVLGREDITRVRPEEQDELICRALTRQRTLLIVDNLETIDDEQINAFLRELPAPTKAIITTRHRIDVAYPILLSGMPAQDGLALIAHECDKKGVTLSKAEADKLYHRTGGVPLAIVWSVASVGLGFSVEAMLRRLGQPSNDIARFCFEGVLERIRGSDAHKLAITLSLFATDASREALGQAAGFGQDILSRDEGLSRLERLSLLHKEGDRFSLLPLTRDYLMHESQQMPQFVRKARQRMLAYYQKLVTPSETRIGIPYWDGLLNYTRIESLDQEWRNVAGLIRWALDEGHEAAALNLFVPCVHFLHMGGLWDERLALSYEMCQVAHELGDPVEVWLWVDAIGYILRHRQQALDCRQALKTGKVLADQLGMKDATILAEVCQAGLKSQTGDTSSAQAKIDQALDQLDLESVLEYGSPIRRLVTRRVVGMAAMLSELREDFVSEKKWYEIELALRRSIGESLIPTLSSLAHVSLSLDDVASAEKYLAEIPITLGKKDAARVDLEWAIVAEKKGEWSEARDLGVRAWERFSRLGIKYGMELSQALLDRLSVDIER